MWVHRSVRWTDLVADEVEYGFIKAVDLAASDHSLARCAAPLASANYCTGLLGCLEEEKTKCELTGIEVVVGGSQSVQYRRKTSGYLRHPPVFRQEVRPDDRTAGRRLIEQQT